MTNREAAGGVVILAGTVVAPLGDDPDDYVAVDTPSGYTFSTTLTSPVGKALLRFKGHRVEVSIRVVGEGEGSK